MPRLDITSNQIERTTNRITSVDDNFGDISIWTDEKYPTAAALQKVLSNGVDQSGLVQNALTQLIQLKNRLDSFETDIAEVKTDIAEVKNRIENETAKTVTYVVPVANSWDMDYGYYSQTIHVPGILATDNPVADIMPGEDNATNLLYSDAMCKVFRITTEDNSITVWATEAISTEFAIQLKVVR